MDAKAEAKALEYGKQQDILFCKQNNIPDTEWNLAEDNYEEYRIRLLSNFWKIWEEDNVKKRSEGS